MGHLVQAAAEQSLLAEPQAAGVFGDARDRTRPAVVAQSVVSDSRSLGRQLVHEGLSPRARRVELRSG